MKIKLHLRVELICKYCMWPLGYPTLSKNAMATENLLILWNPWSPKECKHIKPYFTEFNMKINSEFNQVVIFLYDFSLLLFLFALYLSLTTGTKLQFFIDYMLAQVTHLCLCPLPNYVRQRREREQINSRYSKGMSICFLTESICCFPNNSCAPNAWAGVEK